MKKFTKKFIAVAVAALMSLSPVVVSASAFGASFRDMGANHWATEAVAAVTSLGIMTGDLSGNFNPNVVVDKFEAVRIFARMAGFDPTTHTPAQIAYYNGIFEQRRSVIENAANNSALWNSQLNREIAYLMYIGVLRPADLNGFITGQGNTASRAILTREQAAVYLVRLMGAEQTALTTFGVPLFLDDHLISPASRPHIYFLRSLGILNGSEGNVAPRDAVTRAAMASLVNLTLLEINAPMTGGGNNNANNNANNNQNSTTEIISGTITNTFSAFRSLLAVVDSENRILPVVNNAIITIGGVNATFADLQADMTFTAILNGVDVVSISAQRPDAQPPQATTPPAGDSATETPPVEQMRVLDGVIASVSAATRGIGIEIRTINPRGEIVTETINHTVPATAAITRAGATINFSDINVGDLVVARTHNDRAYVLTLEERIRQVSGTLVEKNFGTNSLFPSIVIEDVEGNNHSFTVATSTVITRGNQRNLNSRQLRIGDHIDLWAEYGQATTIQARAVARAFADVYVRDILISGRGQSFITVSDTATDTNVRNYFLVDGQIDPHTITLGSRVRLWFDSNEVTSLHVVQGATATNFTGHIQNITPTQIIARDANFQTRTFNFDANTVFINSITGQFINVSFLNIGMGVQIVSSATHNNRAVSVTVLVN